MALKSWQAVAANLNSKVATFGMELSISVITQQHHPKNVQISHHYLEFLRLSMAAEVLAAADCPFDLPDREQNENLIQTGQFMATLNDLARTVELRQKQSPIQGTGTLPFTLETLGKVEGNWDRLIDRDLPVALLLPHVTKVLQDRFEYDNAVMQVVTDVLGTLPRPGPTQPKPGVNKAPTPQ